MVELDERLDVAINAEEWEKFAKTCAKAGIRTSTKMRHLIRLYVANGRTRVKDVPPNGEMRTKHIRIESWLKEALVAKAPNMTDALRGIIHQFNQRTK
jgi:hypothetical protein